VQFLFEQCAMDIERRELARDSEQVPIGPQVFDLLVYLLQNRERVVTEDDLLTVVWKGRIVSESTRTNHINAARRAARQRRRAKPDPHRRPVLRPRLPRSLKASGATPTIALRL
jgi:DNA-binding winged helix-turn-helix (wHTH) protein